MVKNYWYDLIGADLNYGINEHPQRQMRKLGFHFIKSEPVSIADCWWFRVDEEPNIIPGYITRLGDDFKFSDERIEVTD